MTLQFSNISIKARLVVLLSIAIVALASATIISFIIFQRFENSIGRIYDDRVIPMRLLKNIADSYTNDIIASVNKAKSDLIGPEEALPVFQQARKQIKLNWDEYRHHKLTEEESKLATETEKLFNQADSYLKLVNDTLVAMGEENEDELVQFDGPLYLVIDPIHEKITELVNLQLEIAQQERQQAAVESDTIQLWYTLIASLVILSLCVIGFLLTSSIINPINNIQHKIETIEQESDLSSLLTTNRDDELGRIATAFNNMLLKFNNIIKQVSSSSVNLSSTLEKMNRVSETASHLAQQQKSETEQIATAMNEMASTVQEVARSAGDASGAANNADNEAKAGNAIVKQASRSIDELAHEVENTATVIQQLAQDSDEIGTVIDVIKSIAEQTNLLALNAAIEAARAGEQGRGFAVVADEVRTLAGRTQDSTREIEAMIEKLQSGAQNAVAAMETGREKAAIGVDQTKQVGEALAAITRAVATINDMNTHIASAAEEQSATTEEMNKNIININQLADETANSSNQSTHASAELSKLASDLQKLVGQFKVG